MAAIRPEAESNAQAEMIAIGSCCRHRRETPGCYPVVYNVSDGRVRSGPRCTCGEHRDDGRTVCLDGKCSITTDASGPFINPTFWGTPKGELKIGGSWTVELHEPRELGPAGLETVTVMSIDEKNASIVLKREGYG